MQRNRSDRDPRTSETSYCPETLEIIVLLRVTEPLSRTSFLTMRQRSDRQPRRLRPVPQR